MIFESSTIRVIEFSCDSRRAKSFLKKGDDALLKRFWSLLEISVSTFTEIYWNFDWDLFCLYVKLGTLQYLKKLQN